MNREFQALNQPQEPKTLRSYLSDGIVVGGVTMFVYPLEAMLSFYHTKDVNPYLLENNIKLKSPLGLFQFFKKRDGTYKLWSCFWSGGLGCMAEYINMYTKRYFLVEVMDFKDSYRLDPRTGQKPKISLKKAVRYFFISFGWNVVSSTFIQPLITPFQKMLADYEPVPQYDNFVDCVCKILEKQGFLGLLRGLGYRILLKSIECGFGAFLYYHNQPNDDNCITEDSSDYVNDLYYGVTILSLAICYPIERMVYRAMIGCDSGLELGVDLLQGFFLKSIFTTADFLFYLIRKVKKEEF